jgi:hypothetical protein
MGVGGQRHPPAALPPENIPGTNCIGGWVGPRASLDGWGKSRPTEFDPRIVIIIINPVLIRKTGTTLR